MEGVTHGPLAGDADLERAVAVLDWSFGGRLTWGAAAWLGSVGHETARVLRDAQGVVQAVLCVLPMGQWFGGRRVATGGIAGVGTAPEARGRGVSSALVQRVLRDLRAEGVPLSTLYPASYTLYRRSGFEIAGSTFRYGVAARDIDIRDRELAVRELCDADQAGVIALHNMLAAEAAGNLDRGAPLWGRVHARRGVPATGFGVWAGDALEGYVFVLHAAAGEPGHPYDIEVTDAAARTGRAWRRILTLLRDHGSLGATVRWSGGLVDPMAQLLAEEVYKVEVPTPWMLRLVDVDRAIEARGWPDAPTVELHLEVDDAALPENAGRRVLSIAAGRASVRPGGDGALALDVRALAQLYTGFASATALARIGRLSGSSEAIATADAAFRGPHPWMADMF